jgi:hypothetical protein
MCVRAIQLQTYINKWLQQEIELKISPPKSKDSSSNTVEINSYDLKQLRLSSAEWHHLKLLENMLKNFKDATNQLSQNDKPQIQYIWLMYNRLFDFLDKITEDLEEETEDLDDTSWPEIVRDAAVKGRAKLIKYYSKTDKERGFLFNCATILDPTQKLTIYEV